MKAEVFIKRTHFPVSAERLFSWHAMPGALERLTPSWEKLEVESPAPSIEDGSQGVLRIRVGPVSLRWSFEHEGYIAGRQFRDVMLRGPFKRWEHTHSFQPDGPQECWLEDRILYVLPMGWLGRAVGGWYTRRKLERLFAYRHRITAEAMEKG